MTDLNTSIGPVLDGVILLFPTLLGLVLAALPIIIAMALIGFVLIALVAAIVSIRNLRWDSWQDPHLIASHHISGSTPGLHSGGY